MGLKVKEACKGIRQRSRPLEDLNSSKFQEESEEAQEGATTTVRSAGN
jgi:hypothetical protein